MATYGLAKLQSTEFSTVEIYRLHLTILARIRREFRYRQRAFDYKSPTQRRHGRPRGHR
jgi:hypothetical protein